MPVGRSHCRSESLPARTFPAAPIFKCIGQMMNKKTIVFIPSLLLTACALYACAGTTETVNDGVKVTTSRDALEVETEESGKQKSFDLTVENVGKEPIDLAKGCFILEGPDKYKIVAYTSTLPRTLAPGAIEKGSVTFAGPSSITSAKTVKYDASCQNQPENRMTPPAECLSSRSPSRIWVV